MLGNNKNEIETEYKKEMLLVLEKNEPSTKIIRIGPNILETHLELLP